MRLTFVVVCVHVLASYPNAAADNRAHHDLMGTAEVVEGHHVPFLLVSAAGIRARDHLVGENGE